MEAVPGLGYQPGDHVAIYPQNHSFLVNEILSRFEQACPEDDRIDPDEPVVVQTKRKKPNSKHWEILM